jgi:gliding motility-associated-like protein
MQLLLRAQRHDIMKNKVYLFVISFFLLGINDISAQMTTTTGMTPTDYVQNVLLGGGVTVSNVTYTGYANAIGEFNIAGANNLGMTNGLVMTTGTAMFNDPLYGVNLGPHGPNNTSGAGADNGTPGDPYLTSIANAQTFNAAILEFDFVPNGDTISFNYVFGTEEYMEWITGGFADVFAFVLSGVSVPLAPVNIATLPGTGQVVTALNVNLNSNPLYYVDNGDGFGTGTAPDGPSVQYDGFTVVLQASHAVECGETYHIKLMIADALDGAVDAGVFLEAGSLTSSGVQVAVATVTGDTSIYEGCTTADFIFSRPASQISDTLVINYDISGTAIEGTDFGNFPNPIQFLPGEDTIIVSLNPTDDGIQENLEFVTITAYTLNTCGDTVSSTGTIYILDEPILSIGLVDTTLQCKDDSVLVNAFPSGGLPPYSLAWSNGATGSPVYVSGNLTGDVDYLVTMTDQCGNTFTDTLTVNVVQTLAIDTLTSAPSTCEPTGWVSATVTGVTGVPLYEWIGPGPNSSNSIDATVWQDLSSGWYYFTVQDNLCTDFDSVFVDILDPPNAQLTATPLMGCGPLQVDMTNSSQNADSFIWNFGNGQQLNIATTAPQSQTYASSAVIQLIAFQGTLCSDTAYASIVVNTCGCTDPVAINYNPLANVNDGSCQYPVPTVNPPNVFTPNGDEVNELFFLDVTNAVSVELVIINRWGNVMFEQTGLNPSWNGKTESGTPVEDGVYFYKYIVNGYNDQMLEGHGFVHLVR